MLATVTICALWIAVVAASFVFYVVIHEPLYTDGGASRVFVSFAIYVVALTTAITFTVFYCVGVPAALAG